MEDREKEKGQTERGRESDRERERERTEREGWHTKAGWRPLRAQATTAKVTPGDFPIFSWPSPGSDTSPLFSRLLRQEINEQTRWRWRRGLGGVI